jgi:hypothetical protein
VLDEALDELVKERKTRFAMMTLGDEIAEALPDGHLNEEIVRGVVSAVLKAYNDVQDILDYIKEKRWDILKLHAPSFDNKIKQEIVKYMACFDPKADKILVEQLKELIEPTKQPRQRRHSAFLWHERPEERQEARARAMSF